MRLETLAWIFLLAAPLSAQTGTGQQAPSKDTPRQALQKAEVLFSQGHTFTADELQSMDSLHAALVDSGDSDLAAELNLLKLAADARAKTEAAKTQAKATLSADKAAWDQRERLVSNQGYWRTVRDVGLATFTISTAATLFLATVNDRNSALLRNGFYSDYDSKNTFNNGMNWAMVGTASAAFLSLFPLLWGEARQ